jgi:hypothetical protein
MEEDQESKSKDTPQRGGGVAARFHAAVAAQNAKHEQRVQGLKAGHALSPGHHITSPIAKDEASVSTPVSRGEYTKRFKESQTSAQKKHLDTTAALREQRLTDFKGIVVDLIDIIVR